MMTMTAELVKSDSESEVTNREYAVIVQIHAVVIRCRGLLRECLFVAEEFSIKEISYHNIS